MYTFSQPKLVSMGLIAEYEIICESLPLVGVAQAVPEATLRVRMRPNEGGNTLFVVTVTDGPLEAVTSAFESAAFVDEYAFVGESDDTYRYQIRPAIGMDAQLGDAIDDIDGLRALATTDSVIDRIQVTQTGWMQAGWFADRSVLERYRTFWQEHGSFRLTRLTPDDNSPSVEQLTDRQMAALQTAYRMGYFEIPRRCSLAAVAEELGIAPSSLSERLRRAQRRLLADVLEEPRRSRVYKMPNS